MYQLLATSKYVNLLIGAVCRRGKRQVACKQVLKALSVFGSHFPLSLYGTSLRFDMLIERLRPRLGVYPKKVAGIYQYMPCFLTSARQVSMAVQWIVQAARKRVDRGFSNKLASELVDISLKRGQAFRKRNDLYRQVISSRVLLRQFAKKTSFRDFPNSVKKSVISIMKLSKVFEEEEGVITSVPLEKPKIKEKIASEVRVGFKAQSPKSFYSSKESKEFKESKKSKKSKESKEFKKRKPSFSNFSGVKRRGDAKV